MGEVVENSERTSVDEQKQEVASKKSSFLRSIFSGSGKLAAGVKSLSKNTTKLASKGLTLLTIKKGFFAERLLHPDILYLRKAVDLSPESAEINYKLAKALFSNKRFNEASLYFKRSSIWDFHNVHAFFGMANAYKELGKYDDAIVALKKATKYHEENADIYYELGVAFEKKGTPVEAINSYKKAVVLRDNFKEALNAITALQEKRESSDARQPEVVKQVETPKTVEKSTEEKISEKPVSDK